MIRGVGYLTCTPILFPMTQCCPQAVHISTGRIAPLVSHVNAHLSASTTYIARAQRFNVFLKLFFFETDIAREVCSRLFTPFVRSPKYLQSAHFFNKKDSGLYGPPKYRGGGVQGGRGGAGHPLQSHTFTHE